MHKHFAAAAVLLVSLAGRAEPAVVRIKLGTLAPQGSTWHQILLEMGQKWAEASGSKVELKVWAGGTQGSEGEMIRKIGIGQLHAASMTAVGLHEITSEPQAEDVPMMMDSYAEYDYVHAKVRPQLEEAIGKKGYVVINWGEVGFVYFFSKEPYKTPAEFAKGKIFTWNGDPGAEEAWKAAGFHPVVLSSIDLIPQLTTNAVNILADPALYAYTAHIFEKAGHMLNLKWGLLTGATVVRKDTWEKIPAELRPRLLAIAEEYGEKVRADVRKQNESSIEAMKKKGLDVVEPADLDGWRKAAAQANTVVRGKVVPAGIYDEVKRLRDEYRAQHSAEKAELKK